MREGETEGRQITAALDQLTDRLNEDEDWAVPVSKRESHRRAVRQLYRDHQKDIPLPRFISLFNEASCIAGDKAASEIETTRWAYFVGTLKQRLSGAATTLPASPLPRTQYTRPASRRPRGEDGYRPPMQIASQQPTFDQQPTSPAQAVDKEAAARRLLLSYGVDQETLELWLKARLRLQEEEPTGFTACFKDAFLARPQPNVALIVLPRRVPVEAAETYEGDLRRALGPLYQVRDLVIKFEQVKVNPALV